MTFVLENIFEVVQVELPILLLTLFTIYKKVLNSYYSLQMI
jgi:hypothetical protein